MKAKELGIAVVGSGRIGTLRARLAAKHPAVRFLTVSDKEIEQAKALADLTGADFYSTDNNEVIARPEVTAVFVSTPEGEHAAPVCKALELGKPVLVEKPLALSLNEAEAILKTVKQTSGLLRIGYSRRFKECFLRAKEQMVPAVSAKSAVGWRASIIHGRKPLLFSSATRTPRRCSTCSPITVVERQRQWFLDQ